MSSTRILVVEDDKKTAELIALYLRHAGHAVEVEHAGDRALGRLADERFDVLVLDVMLPGIDGLELCRRARARGGIGILLVTARTREDERIAGLDLGADDYVTKPFSPRELVARVHAVLRRVAPDAAAVLTRGDITIDRERRTVMVRGRCAELTSSEFALLEALAREPGRVRSRGQLLDLLPGGAEAILDRTVDAHIRNLRRKIEPDPSLPVYIETVVGAGYRFADRSTTES
jgi:DNA-binding response OmpR family regulator